MSGFPITCTGQTRYPMGSKSTVLHRSVKRLSFWGTGTIPEIVVRIQEYQ